MTVVSLYCHPMEGAGLPWATQTMRTVELVLTASLGVVTTMLTLVSLVHSVNVKGKKAKIIKGTVGLKYEHTS